ncbi:MAG: GWxTD domain-containing protein [Bacteroidetes bacterium]|nr:GWxTD domain-containing protein [Bacteroidota bacterium]
MRLPIIKHLICLAALFMLQSNSTTAFSQQDEKSLRAYLSYATFNVPDSDPYVEVYLAVAGSSVVFVPVDDNQFQASVDITLSFSRNDSIRSFAKYTLRSPKIPDLSRSAIGIIDQQRFFLPQGTYTMNVELSDPNNAVVPPFSTSEVINLEFDKEKVQFSAIQLLERFEPAATQNELTKNGYDLIPMVYAFYPASSNRLNFYSEIYHSDKVWGSDGKFLVSGYIESSENLSRMNDFVFRKRMDARPVNIVLHSMDISQLPSGNYNLVLEVRDQQNKLITNNKVFFQRSNPGVEFRMADLSSVVVGNTFASRITHADTLRDFLRCIAPIASEAERDYAYNLAKTNDLATMQRFFYNFWQKRNYDDPATEWEKYYLEVRKVNAAYATPVKKGYNTDRGRVYLKYGPPDQVVESYSEPGAYPYEIWHYYTLGRQRNKRFVFATKDMVTNDFVLIHSDAIGELSNYRWQLDIYKRTWDPHSIDATRPEDIFGNRADDFFRTPR